jgi:hypothetical protein
MFQELEGNKPVVISRNHMDRVRAPVNRWMEPPDWSPAWNYQRSLLSGLAFGGAASIYYQFYTPATELLAFYRGPVNLNQLGIFISETLKLESFRTGFLSKLSFYSLYGLTFEASRIYLWRDFNGGYPADSYVVDIAWLKKYLTAFFIGMVTCWIPVPFNNVVLRYNQDKILPKELSRGYKGYFDAAYQIATKDGLFPFIRGSGPLMAEKTLQTTGMFFWMDSLRDKLKHVEKIGDFPGVNPTTLKFFYIGFGTYMGLLHGYPALALKHYVESTPLNSKGEPFFATYSEGLWKILGDTVNFSFLWSGFHSYLFRAGPPLFATLWFADSMGLLRQYYVEALIESD